MKINELRRSSSIIPKQNGVTQFMNYIATLSADELKRTYVSFTTIDKLGINPRSTYSTPVGIYAYPADYVRLEINRVLNSPASPLKSTREISGFDKVVPFAGESKFFNVFQVNGNVVDLGDEDQCREAKLDLMSAHNIKTDILPSAYKQNTIAEEFWSLSLYIANGRKETLLRTSKKESIHTARRWNRVFRDAGIDGVVDSEGLGVIHGNEPTQAVFFNSTVIKNVKRFVNTTNSGNTEKEPLQKEKLGNFFVKRILQTPNLVEKIKANFSTLWFHNCIAAHDSKLHKKSLSIVGNLEGKIANDINTAITNNQSFGKILSGGYDLSKKVNNAVSIGREAINVYKIYPKDNSSETVESAVKQYLTPSLKYAAWRAFVSSFINIMDTWVSSMYKWGTGPDGFKEWIDHNVPSHMQESQQFVQSGKLTELRKSSAVMPRKSGVQQLVDYAETLSDEQIDKSFVSFTSIDKLGINPQSTYSTPNGIYAYPLEYVVRIAKIAPVEGKAKFYELLPFAGDAPFFNVFQVEGNIVNLHDYDQVGAELSKMKQFCKKIAELKSRELDDELPEEYKKLYPADELWSYSLYIANGFSSAPVSSTTIARKWATVFRKVGIDGVVDEGAGIIHENEPTQAVFFSASVIKNVRRFVNYYNHGSATKTPLTQYNEADKCVSNWMRTPLARSKIQPLFLAIVEAFYQSTMLNDQIVKQEAKRVYADLTHELKIVMLTSAIDNNIFSEFECSESQIQAVIQEAFAETWQRTVFPSWWTDEQIFKIDDDSKIKQAIKKHANPKDESTRKLWLSFKRSILAKVQTLISSK